MVCLSRLPLQQVFRTVPIVDQAASRRPRCSRSADAIASTHSCAFFCHRLMVNSYRQRKNLHLESSKSDRTGVAEDFARNIFQPMTGVWWSWTHVSWCQGWSGVLSARQSGAARVGSFFRSRKTRGHWWILVVSFSAGSFRAWKEWLPRRLVYMGKSGLPTPG